MEDIPCADRIAGLKLCYEVDFFPGNYIDEFGKYYDLRPNDNKHIRPSLKTFADMETSKLQDLLLKAYKSQLKELKSKDHKVYGDILYETKILIPMLSGKIELLTAKMKGWKW